MQENNVNNTVPSQNTNQPQGANIVGAKKKLSLLVLFGIIGSVFVFIVLIVIGIMLANKNNYQQQSQQQTGSGRQQNDLQQNNNIELENYVSKENKYHLPKFQMLVPKGWELDQQDGELSPPQETMFSATSQDNDEIIIDTFKDGGDIYGNPYPYSTRVERAKGSVADDGWDDNSVMNMQQQDITLNGHKAFKQSFNASMEKDAKSVTKVMVYVDGYTWYEIEFVAVKPNTAFASKVNEMLNSFKTV